MGGWKHKRVSEKVGGAGEEAREVWYSAPALRQKKLFHLSSPCTITLTLRKKEDVRVIVGQ